MVKTNHQAHRGAKGVALKLTAWLFIAGTHISGAEPSDRTLRLCATNGSDSLQVEAVERGKIDEKLFADLVGLRLWTDNAKLRQQLLKRIADPVTALGIREELVKAIMEFGVEPDTIPVGGKKGKEMGVEGMVLLKGGEFSRPGKFWDSSGGGLSKDQKPSTGDNYRVQVSSFFVDKFKVTNEDYCRFLNDGNAGYVTPWNPRITRAIQGKKKGLFVPADNSLAAHPVVLVNWYQAKGFAAWAGKRLPTEAEWEYAATGKEGRKYPWGSEEPDETRADIPIQHHGTVPVDWYPKSATPEGVFQMVGNSAEWCADYFDHASYAKAPPGGLAINPTGAKNPFQPDTWYKYRVMFKGWCKSNRFEYFTSTKRHSRPPLTDASAGVSFRCVKNVFQ
jgi:formylglycine-generating enzyme required for sulfatase activity